MHLLLQICFYLVMMSLSDSNQADIVEDIKMTCLILQILILQNGKSDIFQ